MSRMTREEAITELSVIWERLSHPEECENGCYSFRDGDYIEALDKAIEALSAEETPTLSEKHQLSQETSTNTSTDLISRADAIEAVGEAIADGCSWYDALSALPSAEAVPKHDVEIIIDEITKRTQSADRPTGEWIDVNGDGTAWKCDQCGEIACCNDNFCPNCGADMRLKEDKTDRSNPRLKELDKLEKYIVEKGISYDRFDEAGRIDEETGCMLKGNKHQIYVPKRGEDWEWAVFCQNGSEGYEAGRLELYGDLVDVDKEGDMVVGFLTADDVIRRLENGPCKGGADMRGGGDK